MAIPFFNQTCLQVVAFDDPFSQSGPSFTWVLALKFSSCSWKYTNQTPNLFYAFGTVFCCSLFSKTVIFDEVVLEFLLGAVVFVCLCNCFIFAEAVNLKCCWFLVEIMLGLIFKMNVADGFWGICCKVLVFEWGGINLVGNTW